MTADVTCPYCGNKATLADGATIYLHRPELSARLFWHCALCAAWVGCHRNTVTPLGRLANAELRRAKMSAHAAFDRLWKAKMRKDGVRKKEARGKAYQWLSDQLGTAPEGTHIGMFDVALCQRVVEVCAPYLKTRQVT